MAAQNREGPDHLTLFDQLQDDPTAFHIFLAFRVMEAAYPDAPPLGRSRRPQEDRMRLEQEPSLSFEPSSIARVSAAQGSTPGRFVAYPFGLFGPQGPLPAHLTEYARDRKRQHRDTTFYAFANMLTHRVTGLIYRAWTTGNPAAAFDRGQGSDLDRKVAAVSGHLGPGLSDRDSMPDLARRHFAGLLAPGPRHPGGLVAMVAAFFGASVRISEFVGSWLPLDPADRWQLGSRAGLGHNTSIGNRVWSRSAKFRIHIGPMSLADYSARLPGSDSMRRLTAIVNSYVGQTLDWDVNLILRGDEVPAAQLGGNTRLGHTSWLGGRPDGSDAEDVIFSPAPEPV
ncbi:type VI secretion system baseplate subunit TssG [Pseudooceanicola sp. C21-150M6]|uniref:type VI secretion system baseplate subunit TssG n=1 Tax=Pseudooceanicola sp. C21-150M6 TaxID=3434355 RepID=UPI003D7F1D46